MAYMGNSFSSQPPLKFFVHWKNGERAFTFNTVTDLNSIRNIYDETRCFKRHHAPKIGQKVPSQTHYNNKTKIAHDNNNNSKPKIQQQQI